MRVGRSNIKTATATTTKEKQLCDMRRENKHIVVRARKKQTKKQSLIFTEKTKRKKRSHNVEIETGFHYSVQSELVFG